MVTDIEIAHSINKKDIRDVAASLGLCDEDYILYGTDKAKITKSVSDVRGKLILVTAVSPTPYGEGKTTVSIGLGDALQKLGKHPVLVLREPSMGPVFGMKGGATGGGYSQVVPMEDINLHFTGDFHAITSANDLLSAAIDNHIYHGNKLGIEEVTFNRCLDVNDRALRRVSLEGRSEKFNITAASEIMALLCLANSSDDLKKMLGDIVIGYNRDKQMIFAKDLHIEGALATILKDAFYPNLVQTLEHTPTIIHGGPFANIAHGCNSIVATKLGLSLGDYVITEAGFGADLGAEKFFDIKCRKAHISPDCVVLVVTVKALKYNAGVSRDNILEEDVDAVSRGICNLEAHVSNLKKFKVSLVVCLNAYDTDTEAEHQVILDWCRSHNIFVSVSTAYRDGGEGALKLAHIVEEAVLGDNQFQLLYKDNDTIFEKIEKVATEIYHANRVIYSDNALQKIELLEKQNLSYLPICGAKNQYSLSDDAKKLGNPSDYPIYVRDIELYHGAGFITVLFGNILRMPGLPKQPNYEKIDLIDGEITGIS
ncbi:MAG TPA: formate--tetrahydrofolate ligase [Candidatus Faecimonas gallistercoris]|nr:formate--tetrahydrofolate ligase [Candidatus Faecimonas gallistercoris]